MFLLLWIVTWLSPLPWVCREMVSLAHDQDEVGGLPEPSVQG